MLEDALSAAGQRAEAGNAEADSAIANGAANGQTSPSHAPESHRESAPESAPERAAVDIWAALDDRLDLGAYVPMRTPDIELREVVGRGHERFWVLRSPTPRYVRLDATDLDLWQRMDGRQTVYQIAVGHFSERGGFVADRLMCLVRRLRADGFLGPAATDAFVTVEQHLRSNSRVARLTDLAGRLLELDLIRVTWAERAFARAYRAGGKLLYARPARVLWVFLIVAGLAAWWRQVLLAEHALLQTNGSYTNGLFTLGLLHKR